MLNAVGSAHPLLIFFALAFLPLMGAPTSPLWVLAGVRLGTAGGFAISALALLVNYTLGYWLARKWFREPLLRLIQRRGWKVPQFSRGDESLVILLLRVTPGVPLFVQNYLLGIAKVGFARYLILSSVVQLGHVLGFVWLGTSLASSTLWKAVLAGGALVAAGLLLVLLRRWLNGRAPSGIVLGPKTIQS